MVMTSAVQGPGSNAAISLCEKGGVCGEAVAVLGSMSRDRINLCEKGAVWGEACGLLGSMATDGILENHKR